MGECVGWNRSRVGTRVSAVISVAAPLLALACGNSRSDGSGGDRGNSGGSGGTAASAGSGAAGRGGSTGGSSGTDDPGGAAGASDDCAPTPLVGRRLVRLSDNQVKNSVTALAGADVTERAIAGEFIVPPEQRPFPPLAETGGFIGLDSFSLYDRVARIVGENARDDFEALSNCPTPTDACARDYLTGFAEKAFRRPLTVEEIENFLTVYDECKSFGGTVQEAVQHGVWAVLDSPGFLYRTEFGEGDPTAPEVALTPHEMASELAYFLTDAPPDDELLAAAQKDELSTPDEIGAHALRLLETQAARSNFEAAMMSYFGLAGVANVVVDPMSVPGIDVDSELLASMAHEANLFFENTLWGGALGDLLVSRRAFVNERVATLIYGVPAPTTVDADGFGEVLLPEIRAGLLTSSPFLTRLARPDGASVVARGLSVNWLLACQPNPPFPEGENLPDRLPDANATERAKADFRAVEPPCSACHPLFDPYGLALDVFDSLGRARSTDSQGRPIDSAVTLPETFESQRVSGPAEMAEVIAESRVYRACLAMSTLNYALGDESHGSARAPSPNQPPESCHVDEVVRGFDASGDPSFSNLVVHVARSRLLRLRRGDP